MALHAVQNIARAFTVTKEYLTPLDVRQWVKLAIVVFFIGGGVNLPSFQYNTSGGPGQVPQQVPEQFPELVLENGVPFSVPLDVVTAIVAVVVGVVLLGLLFALISAIMEFVFIESLRRGEVSIRRYWSKRWRQGLRLFGFRIVIGLPALGLFLGWMALLFVPLATGFGEPLIPLSVFLLGIPFLFVFGLLFGLISTFTTVFVVPLMIQADSGVLAGWRRLWGSIKSEWRQYLAYAVIGFLLTVVAGLLASLVLGLAAVVVLIPLTLIAISTHVAVTLSSTVGLAILVVLGGIFLVIMVILSALVQVPVVTYLRYYALLVLGDIDDSFDIIPEQREAVTE